MKILSYTTFAIGLVLQACYFTMVQYWFMFLWKIWGQRWKS